MKPKTIISLAILVLVLIVLLQNTTVITLRFLFWEAALSQAIVGILLLVIGVLTGYLLAKIPKKSSTGNRKTPGERAGG